MLKDACKDALTRELFQIIADKDADCMDVAEATRSVGDADWPAVLDALAQRFTSRGWEAHAAASHKFTSGDVEVWFDRRFGGRGFQGSRQCDWPRVFSAALGRIEGDVQLEVKVPVPVGGVARYVQDERASRYQGPYDVAVYRLLADRGAVIEAPGPAEVVAWCDAEVRDFLFELKGWSEADVAFGAFVGDLLLSNHNVDGYRWVQAHRPGLIRDGLFSASRLYDEGDLDLFLAVVENAPAPIKMPRAVEALARFAGAGDLSAARLLLENLAIPKAGMRELCAVYAQMSILGDAQELVFRNGCGAQGAKLKPGWTKRALALTCDAALRGELSFVKAAIAVYGGGSFPADAMESANGKVSLATACARSRDPELVALALEACGKSLDAPSFLAGIVQGPDSPLELNHVGALKRDAVRVALDAYLAKGRKIPKRRMEDTAVRLLLLFADDGEYLDELGKRGLDWEACWQAVLARAPYDGLSAEGLVRDGRLGAISVLLDRGCDPKDARPLSFRPGEVSAESMDWLAIRGFAFK